MLYPKSLAKLIEDLKMLPGVGQKTAERYALRIISLDEEKVSDLSQSLLDVKQNITHCEICGNLAEERLCPICKNDTRDSSIICVVANTTDTIAMEKTETYNGLYHVLNGLISPAKGILPDNLNIESIKQRLKDEKLEEVVIATNLTVEGDTTALYLSKLVQQEAPHVTVSRIAHGLPVGGHLDYADDLTIIKAMEGRFKI